MIGAQVVSVPMAVPLARADQAFKVFMASLVGVFVAIGVVLNLMLYLLVIRPVTALSTLADRVSLGRARVPEFATRSRDEIGDAGPVVRPHAHEPGQAMKMLDS